jgi:hypothetical protein
MLQEEDATKIGNGEGAIAGPGLRSMWANKEEI